MARRGAERVSHAASRANRWRLATTAPLASSGRRSPSAAAAAAWLHRLDPASRQALTTAAKVRARQHLGWLHLVQLLPPAKNVSEPEALRGLEVPEPRCAALATPRGRGVLAFVPVGALGSRPGLPSGVIERPCHPVQRHREEVQLGGQCDGLPYVSSGRRAHPCSPGSARAGSHGVRRRAVSHRKSARNCACGADESKLPDIIKRRDNRKAHCNSPRPLRDRSHTTPVIWVQGLRPCPTSQVFLRCHSGVY